MRVADRQCIQVTIVGWLVIYGLFLVRALSVESRSGLNAIELAFAVVLIALAAAMVAAVVVALPLRIATNLIIEDRRRSHRSETIRLALLLLIAAYILEGRREIRRLAPPPGVSTLSAFAASMPPPQKLQLVSNGGRPYIAWTGDDAGICNLPSGPSCYIFDEKGRLVRWQPVTGDGGPVEDFLRSSAKQRQLTLDEAQRIIHGAPTTAER